MRSRLLIALAALAAAATIAAVAFARTNAPTVKLKSEPIATLKGNVLADAKGRTLYRLKPETARHLLCTSPTCMAVWPLYTVRTKNTKVVLPKGITGPVKLLKRGKRLQVMVKGQPLYHFAGDSGPKTAAGQGIVSFGGTWGTLKVKGRTAKSTPAPPTTTPGGYGY